MWGRGGRIALALVACLALVLPAAATAKSGSDGSSYLAPGLLARAIANPDANIRVIVQSVHGATAAEEAVVRAASSGSGNGEVKIKRRLKLIGAVAAELKGKHVEKLAEKAGLVVTPDSVVRPLGDSSTLVWPSAANATGLWSSDGTTCAEGNTACTPVAAYLAPAAPAIAIVDSGIQPRADFGDRLIHSQNLYTGTGTNSPGDGRGHGTMVAALAAGGAAGYAGAAPNAKLVSLDVIDDGGAGRASDVIAAVDWIVANKDQYNIRVANFSLGAGSNSSFRFDPLDKAVQKLWFAGVVVVTSSGNYAAGGAASGVKYAPASDPFVITVGSSDIGGTADVADDTIAPFSSWGYTPDGFSKPDLSAPGRYMVSAVPSGSQLPALFPERVVAEGYMRMSGTSFAAAVVSGAAAQILARHPEFSPDQVKGALMLKARPLPLVSTRAGGVGELDTAAAAGVASPPNPNSGLNQFKIADPNGGSIPVFDHNAWFNTAKTNSTWDTSTWSESGWSESTWDETTWSESTWSESGWSESTWSESSWNESTWNESGWSESTWDESSWVEAFAAE